MSFQVHLSIGHRFSGIGWVQPGWGQNEIEGMTMHGVEMIRPGVSGLSRWEGQSWLECVSMVLAFR